MSYLILPIVYLLVAAYILKLIVKTPQGAFILILAPLCLLVVNLSIKWSDYWMGIPFPNPFDPGGFLYDILGYAIGGGLDTLLHVHFFQKTIGWILGAAYYSLILGGLQVMFYNIFLSGLRRNYAISFFLIWAAFFTYFYLYHKLDHIEVFNMLSMPYKSNVPICSYYWVGMAIGLWHVVNDSWDRTW